MGAKSVLTCAHSETCSLTLKTVPQHHCDISCVGQATADLLAHAKLIPSRYRAELLGELPQTSHRPKLISTACLPQPA